MRRCTKIDKYEVWFRVYFVTCLLSRTLHSCARRRKALRWTGRRAERRNGACMSCMLVNVQSLSEPFIHHMTVKVYRKPNCATCVQTHLQLSLCTYRCVNGHCESTSKNIGRSDGLKHNSLDGSWGSWSRWWFKDVDIINAINSYSEKKQKSRNQRKEKVSGWPD